jgi:hypothetical protein
MDAVSTVVRSNGDARADKYELYYVGPALKKSYLVKCGPNLMISPPRINRKSHFLQYLGTVLLSLIHGWY